MGSLLIQVINPVVTEVSIDIPLADAGSLTTGPTADTETGFEIKRLPKASWRISPLFYGYSSVCEF